MKAYAVTTTRESEASVLVFAKNPTAAKRIALTSDWLHRCDWIDLRARRERKADDYDEKLGVVVVNCRNAEECRLLRDLGWFELEGGGYCEECDLHEWGLVLESHLEEVQIGPNEWMTVCAECAKKMPEYSPEIAAPKA